MARGRLRQLIARVPLGVDHGKAHANGVKGKNMRNTSNVRFYISGKLLFIFLLTNRLEFSYCDTLHMDRRWSGSVSLGLHNV